MTKNPNKQPLRERASLRAWMKGALEEIPWLKTLLYSDLLWGCIFTILIVLLLLPLQPLQEEHYSLNSIAKEMIVAPKDLRIPDFEATEKKKSERLAAVRSIYRFDDSKWRRHVNRITQLFTLGRRQIETFSSEIEPERQEPRYQALAEDENFLLSLEISIIENLGTEVPRDILELLSATGFDEDLQNRIAGILESILARPIVNTTLYPPLPAGYELRAVEDTASAEKELVSLRASLQELRDKAEEELGQLSAERRKTLADWLQTFVVPTAELDAAETDRRLAEARNVETLYFAVQRGEVIVRPGDRITDADTLAKINFIIDSRTRGMDFLLRSAGLTVLTVFLLFAMAKFAQYVRRREKVDFNLFLLLCLTMAINLTVVRLALMISESFSSYFTVPLFQNVEAYYWAVPFAAGSMLTALVGGTGIALIYSITLVVFTGLLFGGNFTVILYALVGCFTVIYGLRKYRERTALIKTGVALGLMNIISILTLGMLSAQPYDTGEMILGVTIGFFGGLLTAFVASFTLPLLESVFQLTTDVKLLELSNHEHPLLRELFLRAPGTFQHSIVVGYLAEAAATAIGANPLFCRVSCLYHDVGKMLKPSYYVENREVVIDKHKELSPHMSSLIIINHVKEGMELAHRYRLPRSIIDIIPQHHGTKLIRYFYEKARRQRKPELGQVKEEEFRYPGPKPQTREAGIIMLADGVEASVRTLEDRNTARLKGAIKTITENTFLDGQLDECDLTFKDLSKISEAFHKVLLSMHHERIKYPGIELETKTGKRFVEKVKGKEKILEGQTEPEPSVKKAEDVTIEERTEEDNGRPDKEEPATDTLH